MKVMERGGEVVVATLLFILMFPQHSSSYSDSFIYLGCTELKYNPATPYESNVNSVLASLLNSASISSFKISSDNDLVYGLFQCRGDLTYSQCHSCVGSAVSRLGTYHCVGAALQLEGCFVKYDNMSFVGAQDKSVVYNKCGAPESNLGSERDAVLADLTAGGVQQESYFRVGESGRVQGMAQCLQDLSEEQCQECLLEAKQRLQMQCATSPWGDMFLAKCYARYSYTYSHTPESEENNETDKTLALTIGVIAAATLLVIFLSFLSKSVDSEDGK